MPFQNRVLIADDNRDGADMLAHLLRAWGCAVSVAYDGQQALDVAASFVPGIAILDINMPVLDGYAVARSLRSHSDAVFLVAHTGAPEWETARRATEAGFDLHLAKPVAWSAHEHMFRGAQPRRPLAR